MKKIATSLLALAVGVAFATSAFGATLMSETFTYPDGPLSVVGAPFWTVHSGTGTDVLVSSGTAVGNMADFPDLNRTFAARLGNQVTYACFNAMIPTPAATPVTNYFAHLKDSGTGFTARVYVTASGGSFTFGIGTGSTMTATWPVALNYGQTYKIAISYNGVNGVSQMWVDPVSELSTSITSTAGATGVALQAFALRQSNSNGTAWTYVVDNAQVGDTFADACGDLPTPASNSTWGRVKSLYR